MTHIQAGLLSWVKRRVYVCVTGLQLICLHYSVGWRGKLQTAKCFHKSQIDLTIESGQGITLYNYVIG